MSIEKFHRVQNLFFKTGFVKHGNNSNVAGIECIAGVADLLGINTQVYFQPIVFFLTADVNVYSYVVKSINTSLQTFFLSF